MLAPIASKQRNVVRIVVSQLLLLLLLLNVCGTTTTTPTINVASAADLPLPFNYTYGQKVPDTCSSFLYQTNCGLFQNDNKVQYSSFCPLHNKTALGLPTAFDGFPSLPAGPTVYCPNTGTPRYYEVPEYVQHTLQTVTTLAGFIPNVNFDDESPISVVTLDGVEYKIGSFIPFVNTLSASDTAFRNRPTFFASSSENSSWPYNGHVLCQGQTSYQVWSIPDTLRAVGVKQIKIYDVKSTLRVFAVTIDNCTAADGHYVNYGDVSSSVTTNFSVTIDSAAVGTVVYSGTLDWPTCALRLAQQRQYAEAFVYDSSSRQCSIVNSTTSFVRSATATTNVFIHGQTPRQAAQFGSISPMPTRASTIADTYSITRPDIYGNMTPYLLLRASSEPVIDQTISAQNLQSYAVGLGGSLDYSDGYNWLRLTVRAGGRISLCGEPNQTSPASNVPMPFIAKSGRNASVACNRFYHCAPQQFFSDTTSSMYNGKIDIDYNSYPKNSNCSTSVDQGLMTMVFADPAAKLTGSSYKYLLERTTTTAFSTPQVALEYFRDLHELSSTSSIVRLETKKVGTALMYFYGIDSNPWVAPSWRWSDSYHRAQSSAVWCSAYHAPQFRMHHRTSPSVASTTYNCGNYASIFNASAACLKDVSCLGYTIVQDPITYDESPNCLISALSGALEASELTTYAEKNTEKPTCVIPANDGKTVTVRVTSAVSSSTVYEVYGDSTLLGSCTALSTATSGKESCTQLFTCWSGVVPANTENVYVIATASAGFASPRCADYFMAAVVEFSLDSTYFEPDSTCLTAIDLLSPTVACTASAVTTPCASGTRLVQNLTYPSTACTSSFATMMSVYGDISPSSSTAVGVLVAVDMSGMDASTQGSGLVTILVHTEDGIVEPIGYIQRDTTSGAVSSFSVDDTPNDSFPTCSVNSEVTSSSLANAEFLIIPQLLANKKITRVELRGPSVQFVSAFLADRACLPVFSPADNDNYFAALADSTMPTGPLISTTASTTYGNCAIQCQASTYCFIFAWKANECYMFNSLGTKVVASPGTTVGTKPRSTTTRTVYDTVPVIGSTIGDIFSDLKQSGHASITAFMTEPTAPSGKPIRLLVKNVDRVQVAVAQTAFASGGFVSVGAVSSGGIQSCGSFYDPYIGATLGASSQCEALSACRSLSFRGTTSTHVTLTPINPDTAASTCTTKFWGLLGSSGTVDNGVEFYRVAVFDGATTTNSITDLQTSVNSPVVERFTSTVNGVLKRLVLSEDAGIPASTLSYTSINYCRVSTRTIYAVTNGTISASNKYSCSTLSTNVNDVMDACSKDVNCNGFTTNAAGVPQCYSKAATTDSTLASTTDIFFKRATLTSCKFTLSVPGQISVSIAQLHLGSTYENDVTILNNGRTLHKCGSTNPFLTPSGFVDETTSDCSKFLECYNGLVVAAGTLEIVFPQPADISTTSPYSCTDAGGSHHFGAAIVDFVAAAASSRSLHAVAATLPVSRIVSTTDQAFSFDFMVSLATSYAAEVKQDRYSCGFGCVVPFSLNVSLEERVRRCGGLAGFEEGVGLEDSCRNYYYCGEVTGSTGSQVATVYPSAITGSIRMNMVSTTSLSTAFCGNTFDAIVYTNGLMISADGDGSNSVRTFYAKSMTATSTTLPTVATLKTGLAAHVAAAHPEMSASDLATATVYNKVFPVTSNLETSVSSAYAIYDFLGVEESLKSIHNGTVACVADKISVDGQTVRCRVKVNSNHITVRVAQTKFDSTDDFVTITTSAGSFSCGGDNSFFGLAGLLDACDTYFTCYDGFITAGEIITIEFATPTMIKSRCRPGVMALVDVDDSEVLPPLDCTGDFPLACPLARTCLSLDQICDRTSDCPDGSDESRCSLWKTVGTQLVPSCTALAFDSTATTEAACKRFAILKGTPTVLTYNSSGCAVYTCVDFNDPQLLTIPTVDNNPTTLMVYTRDAFSFLYCTADLQCTGNGKLSTTAPPCSCICDFAYVGDDCSSPRKTDYSHSLVFVYPPNIVINAGITSPLTNVLLRYLQTSSTVALRFVEHTDDHTLVYLLTKDPSGIDTTSYELNTLFYNTTYTAIMDVAAANGNGMYFTTENANSQERQAECHINSYATTADSTCTSELAEVIADPHTVTVEIQGVQFSTATQFVDIALLDGSDTVLNTQRCQQSNGISTRDSTITGACGYLFSCSFNYSSGYLSNVAKIQTVLSSGMNPSSTSCNGYIGNVVTRISGRSSLVEDESVQSPTSSTDRDAIYIFIFFGVFAIGIVGFILFVTWFRLRTKHPKLFCIGPLVGAISLFLIGFGFCILAFYLSTSTDNYSHMIVIDDFRDERCSLSPISTLPLTTSIAPANGKCNRVISAGRNEGALYISASFGVSKVGLVEFRVGASLSDCEASEKHNINLQQCVPETVYLNWKPQKDGHFMSLRGATSEVALQRLKQTRAANPQTGPTVPIVVTAVPASQHYDVDLPNSNTFVYDREKKQTIRVPDPEGWMMVPRFDDAFISFSAIDEVRFQSTIEVPMSLFSSSGDVYVDALPANADDSNVSTFYPAGALFNAQDIDYVRNGRYSSTSSSTSTSSSSSRRVSTVVSTSSIFAYYFLDIQADTLQMASLDTFTLTFWTKLARTDRGFVFATTDSWITDSGTSPILTTLADLIESGGASSGEIFLDGSLTDWTVYSAVYVSGYSREIYLLKATSNNVVEYVRWSAEGVGAGRLFDGGWHFVTITSLVRGQSNEYQLYIDGETDATADGWVQCNNFKFPSPSTRSVGSTVYVSNDREESVLAGEALVIGQIDGGIFGIKLYPNTVFTQEDIFVLGAEGMDNYYSIAVAESLVIGIVTAIITAVMVLYSVYRAFRREFGVNEDEFEDEAVYDERGRKIHTDKKAQSRSTAFTSSVRFSSFVEPFLLLLQVITLFITMWTWPSEYADFFDPVAFFSFDLNFFLPGIPLVTWVLITYAAAAILLILFVVASVKDNASFEIAVGRYREMIRVRAEKKNRKKKVADDELFMLDIPKPHYKWFVNAKGGSRPLTQEQQELLLEKLNEICTARTKRETNMRVFTKTLVNMGEELGEGIILYERLQGRIFISFRTSMHDLQHDQQSPEIDVTQTYFELRSDNISCPDHKHRLLPEDIHNAQCVHSTNPYYRSKECPTKCVMYLCPEDGCDYAVCEHCYGGGAIGGGVADAIQQLKSARKKGVGQSLGALLMLLLGLVYLPAIKYALMIVSCHNTYRCEFDGCWESPTSTYIIMVLLSVLILVCVGLGFIYLQIHVLVSRRTIMSEVLPLQTRKHGGSHNRFVAMFLSKRTVLREDYIDFLDIDTTITGAIYRPYEYDYFATSPLLLLYRLVLTMVVVLVLPNTLFQLGAATLVSLIFCFSLIIISPYLNVWLELLVRLGAFHNLVELALMSLHRVDIRDNPDDGGYTSQMIATTFLYIGIVILLLIITVVVPYIRKKWTARERREMEATAREEEDYDIGFWGESHGDGQASY